MYLDALPGTYAVARLSPGAPIPAWANAGGLLSITRTPEELSIVCPDPPPHVDCKRGWKCLKVRGPLDFSLTGVLASLAAPLAQAGVPIFVISTFDTDYVLFPETAMERAVAALTQADHVVL